MQEWLIFTPANLKETNWEFLSEALEDARQCWLFLKFWLSATAKNVRQLSKRRREPSVAELNTQSAFQLADLQAGGAQKNVAAESGFSPSEPVRGHSRYRRTYTQI